jgi:hypothetical protein
MPYVGPALSVIQLSGDNDAGEDNIFGGVAGISLLMPSQNSLRVEAQVFDQVSFSIAAGLAY